MSERKPKVTVGLPVYNGANYLRAAIDAILAQTFTDFELVISDNASTDETQAICEEYAAADSRVRYYRVDQNEGAPWNFNRVIELARGEYYRSAAHDDLCAPTFLERCVEVLDSDPDAVLCAPRAAVIDEDGNLVPEESCEEPVRQCDERLTDEVDPIRFDLLASDLPHQRYRGVLLHSIRCYEEFGLMRTEILRRLGPRGRYLGGEKVVLAKLSLRGRWRRVPESLFFNRWHPQRFSSLATAKEQYEHLNPRRSRWPVSPRRMRCTLAYLMLIPQAPISLWQKFRCFGVWMRFVLRLPRWRMAIREMFSGPVTTAVLDRPAAAVTDESSTQAQSVT